MFSEQLLSGLPRLSGSCSKQLLRAQLWLLVGRWVNA